MEKDEHNETSINFQGQLTHTMSKSNGVLIVQYILAPSSPINEYAIYVHIKCKITPGFRKEKLSYS